MFQAFLFYTLFYQLSVFFKTPASILETGLLASNFSHTIVRRFHFSFHNMDAIPTNNGNTIMLNP